MKIHGFIDKYYMIFLCKRGLPYEGQACIAVNRFLTEATVTHSGC